MPFTPCCMRKANDDVGQKSTEYLPNKLRETAPIPLTSISKGDPKFLTVSAYPASLFGDLGKTPPSIPGEQRGLKMERQPKMAVFYPEKHFPWDLFL